MGGSRREGQHQMARTVADTLDDGAHLLVQAGTGTGKSLAYLVPTLMHAVTRGQRAIVSTATLALQRQVIGHDLPLVADILAERLPRPPEVALLKGWHNYVCKHKVAGGYPPDDEGTLFSASEAAPSAAEDHPGEQAADASLGAQVVRLREWAEETDTGDRDDLVPGVSDRAWRQVSITSMECLGQKCPLLAECYPERARATAREADLVVTNHAMLGIAASGSPKVLPEHEILLVDEAHELTDRVTAQATVELSAAVVERTARIARRHGGVSLAAMDDAAAELRTLLMQVPEGRLRTGLPEELTAAVRTIAGAAREGMSAMKGENKAGGEAGGMTMAKSALLVLFEVADRLLSDRVQENVDVLWCERGRRPGEGSRLMVAPLNVAGPIVGELLAGRSAILTSATLTLGGTFDATAGALGLAAGAYRSEIVSSPFDYGRQGILYVAKHLPPPGRDGTDDQVLDEIADLVSAAGGGTLGLFSSRRGAQAAAEAMRERLDTPVLLQGDDVLPTLVREFAADPTASLFGTLSLWQGVDVPGQSCRLVLIDRIPFPRPDDPIKAARTEAVGKAGGNGFMAISATHAALLLAQGAGRLIRSTTDRGVVAVLDPRLRTARYGTFLAASLPPLWPTTDGEVVRAALRRLAVTTESTSA
ncbi:ATP-dependent DNA helicase [Ruania halotolerans]|uniref:ATP-dependent DNA helicase n=1 Tax=Ruania halotolerans TaxID=2897773 RepID=UPI001E2E472A|nr:ATP-dependent DNA helicase [Ruania halotolerans]UFU08394.1 ATP-dependent DNA helicase [Ruania halotolerans]